jgi:hypothetical protein
MRLWSISPEYLDVKGLVANWREGLLARKVLLGKTKGYRNHPQLIRFRAADDPISAVDNYLGFVLEEGLSRGYRFDSSKINKVSSEKAMKVTKGQIDYEFSHLLNKLKDRDPERYNRLKDVQKIKANRFFAIVPGELETWEKLDNR